ncbi:MAG: DUF4129 domain-containing protein [Propionicimonas sp.]|uniref:DUF4129 domain-containing protein n=1 Tax=Propionicimonas sp. TaxID=1955623 RepID=UPI002B21E3B7|nr:DUF4129 domain-containing protein [Propionicimonas sp.]MEA4942872.1 DUF4129 domain-containing protein [Propionicimonas sp.]
MSPRMIRGGVVAAIILVVLGAAFATPWVVTLTIPRFGPDEPPEPMIPPMTLPPQEPDRSDLASSETLERILLVLLAVLAVAIVGFAVARLVLRLRGAWRLRDEPVADDQLDGALRDEVAAVDLASLATAVARAEAHLAGLAEPADAVTAAWVALEEEAALQGTSRDPAQTATEFTTVLLQRSPAPVDAVLLLRRLYQKARFTTHPITPADVVLARESLARIAAALDAAAPAGQPHPEGLS